MAERITRDTLKIRQRRDLTTLRVNVDRLEDVGGLGPRVKCMAGGNRAGRASPLESSVALLPGPVRFVKLRNTT
jgi:hypothetical protein